MNSIKNIENLSNDEVSIKTIFLSVKYWFIFFKSKWKIIFIVGFIGANIGLAIGLIEKPKYKATLTFALDEDKGGGASGGLSGALGLASSFGIDLGGGGGGAFAASNLSELMKSRVIIEKVLLKDITINNKQSKLIDYYIDVFNLRKDWQSNPNLRNLSFTAYDNRTNFTFFQDSILQVFYKNLIDPNNLKIYQKDKKVTILTIDFLSEDEKFSKLFCENLAIETSNFYIETKTKKSRYNVSILQKQVDSIRTELNSAITGVAKQVDYVYNLNPSLNIKGTPSKKRQIDVQTNTVILTNISVQLELAKVTLHKETPLIQMIDKPIFPLTKVKVGKLKYIFWMSGISLILILLILFLQNIIKRELLN